VLAFYRAYPDPAAIVPQPVAQLLASETETPSASRSAVPGDSLLWSVPWGHHALLMEKVSDLSSRRWYMNQTLTNGWSRPVLSLMATSDDSKY
jgi:hypothetical protein